MYMMFIDGDLKPGKKNEFLKAWSSQILPLLKKQDGFVDEILLLEENSEKPCGLSFWKSKEHAEGYRRDVFPQAKASLRICSLVRRSFAASRWQRRKASKYRSLR
jgi:heme-degrading monooxygenase HmoA